MNFFNLFKKQKPAEAERTAVPEPATRGPAAQFRSNDLLKEAIARHTDRPDDTALLQALYRQLGEGILLLAVDRPPPVDANGVIQEAVTLKMLTSVGPGGGLLLQAFTDVHAAFARIRSGSGLGVIAQASEDVLKSAVEGNYEGMIINAAGPYVIVPIQIVADIRGGKYRA